VQPQPLSLEEKCKKLEETIQRVATNTIGYTRKQALIEIERHRSIQDSRKFYKRLNDVRRPFKPHVSSQERGTIRGKGEGVLKYLKNNKPAGADSIAAELLKNGGPNLVDALHAVI
jgi:hypothetical protein